MASRHSSRASHSRNSAAPGTGGPQNGHGQDPLREQEVNQNQGEVPLPPPPPVGDLVQAINNQTLILEALANAIINKRPREQTMNDKLTAFLRTKPPTFAGSNNPLEAHSVPEEGSPRE